MLQLKHLRAAQTVGFLAKSHPKLVLRVSLICVKSWHASLVIPA